MTAKHLELEHSLKVPGARSLLADADRLYLVNDYGHELSVVDVSGEAPRLCSTTSFKGQLFGAAGLGNLVYLAEWNRALDVVDVSDPARPDYFECVPLLGRPLKGPQRLGDTVLASVERRGLAVFDVREPRRPRLVELGLPSEEMVESFAVCGERIFIAQRTAGLVEAALEGGRLVERGRFPGPGAFDVNRVLIAGGRLYLFGSTKRGGPNLVLRDLQDPGQVLFAGSSEAGVPYSLRPLGEGAVGFCQHYTCVAFGPEPGPARELFKQYRTPDGRYLETTPEKPGLEERGSCMSDLYSFLRRDDRLYAAQEGELNVYRIPADSPLARMG